MLEVSIKMNDLLLTTEQVSNILKCSKRTVGNLRCKGYFKGILIFNRWMYFPEEIEKYKNLLEQKTGERLYGRNESV